MAEPILSRRAFLGAAGGSTAALALAGCASTVLTHPPVYPTINPASPLLSGPFATSSVILGETAGTTALHPLTKGEFPNGQYSGLVCQNGQPVSTSTLPTGVKAAVYYPSVGAVTSSPLNISHAGPFPLLLYAHDLINNFSGCPTIPIDRDFTTVGEMLSHVATYGCVCVAPDLSWLSEGEYADGDFQARMLTSCFLQLSVLNSTLFANQLDLSRVVLVGHGQGATVAILTGRDFAASFLQFRSLSYGLIGPILDSGAAASVNKLLVLLGTLDSISNTAPQDGGSPKTVVTIPGANHLGYTDLCTPNNVCTIPGGFDLQGTISRTAQQQTGAAYLAALVRYYALSDQTARAYLSGARQVEGLDAYNVTGIQVQSQGFGPSTVPTLPPTAGTHP